MAEPRVVIVTGGSRGLGAGIVNAYLEAGDRVATCSRSSTDNVAAWEADPALADRFLFCTADLSKTEDANALVKATLDKWGRIDVLVNNAGIANDGVLALYSDDDIDAVIDLNLKGTLALTRQVVRRMMARQQRGYIVNITSIVGQAGYRGLAVYSATKAGLDGITRALARELGAKGIIVNSVAPGYLRTEMTHGMTEDNLEQITRRTPVGRLGEPADIARLVLFLTDPANTYITGQVYVADGGLTA
jgi:3-oxoacyl-[acyl-carrier protein] reductase